MGNASQKFACRLWLRHHLLPVLVTPSGVMVLTWQAGAVRGARRRLYSKRIQDSAYNLNLRVKQ